MSTPSDVRGLVARTFDEMGGVGSLADVREHLLAILPADASERLIRRGLDGEIRGFFRTKGSDGLPIAPEVDEHGTHMLFELASVEECRYIVRKYMERSRANRSAARRTADRCFATFGVQIDIDNPDESEVA